jgi:hypothetical protein
MVFFGRDIIIAVKTVLTLLLVLSTLPGCSNETPTMKTEVKAAPPGQSALKPPQEAVAVDLLRKINEAQATYFKINRRYALTYDELIEARLLPKEPSAEETGYDFKLRPAADAASFKISVTPSDPSATNARYLFMDQTGVIRAETGKEATADSPAIK